MPWPSRLDGQGTPDGLYGARELHKETVAGRLHDPAVSLLNPGLDDLATKRPYSGQGPFLIDAHQPGEPDHVGGQDSC